MDYSGSSRLSFPELFVIGAFITTIIRFIMTIEFPAPDPLWTVIGTIVTATAARPAHTVVTCEIDRTGFVEIVEAIVDVFHIYSSLFIIY